MNSIAPLEHINTYSDRTLNYIAQELGLLRTNISFKENFKNFVLYEGLKNNIKAFFRPIIRNKFLRISGEIYIWFQKK